MASIVGILLFKLVTLAGSTATTAWAISFFFFKETLAPLRWELFLGGVALVAVGEIGSWLIARRAVRSAPEEP